MHSMIVRARPFPIAFYANASALPVDVRIGLIIGMALGAVYFVAVPWAALPIVLAAMMFLFAGPANALAFRAQAGILCRIRMTLRAAGSLAPVVSASPQILFMRDRFQVSRVHAMPRLAEMVKLQSFGHWANPVLIRQPMHGAGFSFPATGSVTFPRNRAGPEPALPGLSDWRVFSE